MKDLFDIEISENNYLTVNFKNLGYYQKIKNNINYRKSGSPYSRCKLCIHKVNIPHHDKTYNKCDIIGLSRSQATDICLTYTCRLFHANLGLIR